MQRNGGFPHCSTSDPLKIHSMIIKYIHAKSEVCLLTFPEMYFILFKVL